MSMSQFLSEWYGHDSTKQASAEQENLALQAQQELFSKLASANNIDLSKLSEEQVAHLWDRTFAGTEKSAEEAQLSHFAKVATANGIDLSKLTPEETASLWNQVFEKSAEEEDKEKDSEGDDKEKEEAAKKEHEEKKEASMKLAEADYLGRVMAHSLVDELQKMSAAPPVPGNEAQMPDALRASLGEEKEAGAKETAEKAVGAAKKGLHRFGELVSGSKAKDLKTKAETAIRQAGSAKERGSHTIQKGWEGMAKKYAPAAKEEAKKVRNTRIGVGVGAGAAAAGAGALAAKKKESSALDELAAVEAVKVAHEGGWDIDEASERVAAVLTLGPTESEKIAFVQDFPSAVSVRALELLESAGYPVTWENNEA